MPGRTYVGFSVKQNPVRLKLFHALVIGGCPFAATSVVMFALRCHIRLTYVRV